MSYTNLQYHCVFSTKERRRFLSPGVLPRTIQYMGGVTKNLNCSLLLGGGVADHVHLAIAIPPTLAIADVMRDIKANTSSWIHDEFPELARFQWQDSYAAFSVSYSQLGRVKAYIAEQEEHHRKMTFQEELLGLLERHEVPYDPKYIFA